MTQEQLEEKIIEIITREEVGDIMYSDVGIWMKELAAYVREETLREVKEKIIEIDNRLKKYHANLAIEPILGIFDDL